MSRALPSVASWSAAAGRYGSAATSRGRRPSLTMWRASLADVVVLPEPWSPTREMTAGLPVSRKVRSPADSSATSSSCTILTTCWPAVRLPRISAPTARSRIRPTTSLTTLKLTSASSRASRISRAATSTSASLTRPPPVRLSSVLRSRSLRLSNTEAGGSDQDPGGRRGDEPRVGTRVLARRRSGSVARLLRNGEDDGGLRLAVLDEQRELAGHPGRDLEAREQAVLGLLGPDQLHRLAVAIASRIDDGVVGEAQVHVVA